jgi:hypothetical protein
MSKETGGQAFPSLHYKVIENGEEIGEYAQDSGITIRDYFISHAPEMPKDYYKDAPISSLEKIVRWGRDYADAMIAERNKS